MSECICCKCGKPINRCGQKICDDCLVLDWVIPNTEKERERIRKEIE